MDYYKELRSKIRKYLQSDDGKNNKFAEYLLVAPDLLHLLCKLVIDKDVPVAGKAKLGAAIAYFISPLDLIPEAMTGPAGYIDDIALSAYVINSIIKQTEPEVIMRHWAGEGDVFKVVQHILDLADEMVGIGLFKKLKALVG